MSSVEFFFVGGLREDFYITHHGQAHLGVMGGSAAYAAVGARVWGARTGIVARVGSNFPPQWLQALNQAGMDTSGVLILDRPQETRSFRAYLTPDQGVETNPARHFLRLGLAIPKALLGYQPSSAGQDDRKSMPDLAVRPNDLPPTIRHARGVHFCPAHLLSHLLTPATLREQLASLITLAPWPRYMRPDFQNEMPNLLRPLDAFLPRKAEARALFHQPPLDPRELAQRCATLGCGLTVIRHITHGAVVWDEPSNQGWHIPSYPGQVRDPRGAEDAFCGGFLWGLAEYQDPVEAALRGVVSASLVAEGSGVFYALDAMPGLAERRLEALRPLVRRL
jgi:ribokinase